MSGFRTLVMFAGLFTCGCLTTNSMEQAAALGIEGTVVLKVSVDEKGAVTQVEVLEGPGSGLNEAAAEAMWKFKFRPARKAGVPVPSTFNYRYTFVRD